VKKSEKRVRERKRGRSEREPASQCANCGAGTTMYLAFGVPFSLVLVSIVVQHLMVASRHGVHCYQQTTSHRRLLDVTSIDHHFITDCPSATSSPRFACVVLTLVKSTPWLLFGCSSEGSAVRACAHKRVGDVCDWRSCRFLEWLKSTLPLFAHLSTWRQPMQQPTAKTAPHISQPSQPAQRPSLCSRLLPRRSSHW
jgi:hypothetical protein